MNTTNTTTTTTTTLYSARDDQGKLLLRVLLASLLLFHGVSKLFGGVGFITGMLEKMGLPGAFGYLVYIGEMVAPLLILVGLYTRAAAVVVAINMVVALLLVHSAEIFTLNSTGGWAIELQGMYLGAALVVALLGAGSYSIGGTTGHFN
ncbi:DoxX family protein [Telluria aromaticivorans]|uniref:DoxX family protein n=1 Tax=Telluria aromaticivorans TaxID=2725995 RepID=A0A7Y2P209_9BURK|nr:DoxX family protein [Telluria aromaticivorans]NNG25824.1 DoxX family protein [Telluria aromaticivorans]